MGEGGAGGNENWERVKRDSGNTAAIRKPTAFERRWNEDVGLDDPGKLGTCHGKWPGRHLDKKHTEKKGY